MRLNDTYKLCVKYKSFLEYLVLKNKVPDIRARIKALEDRRKSIVCTATLTTAWSVDVRCSP